MARILIVGAPSQLEEDLRARGHAVTAIVEPEHLGAILPELQGVSALAWLGGPDLLESLAAKLVDTHVRGFACLPAGEPVARRFAQLYGMPTAVIGDDPVAAVESILSA